jgi:hypothetical protein
MSAFQMLTAERDHILNSVRRDLKRVGSMAEDELARLAKLGKSEAVHIDSLVGIVEGLQVAATKLATLNHTIRMLEMSDAADTSGPLARK